MSVYEPLSSGVFAAPYRSYHRRELLLVMAWYDIVAGALALAILILTVAPLVRHAPLFGVWPVAYAVYLFLKLVFTRAARRENWFRSPLRDLVQGRFTHRLIRFLPARLLDRQAGDLMPHLQVILASALTIAMFVFSLSVLRADIALGIPLRDSDTLWLLFAVPILRTARFGTPNWVMGITAAAIILNAIVHSLEPLTPLRRLQIIGVESFWLIIICLLPALLSRYLAERKEGLSAAVAVGSEIARLRTTSQVEFANRAAVVIAKRLGFDEVNILVPTSDDEAIGKGLRFLGAASEAGRTLVEAKYVLEHAIGINGWTAVHMREQLVNDIRHDTRGLYYRHDSFPRTQSELSMPLLLGDKLLGVLDVQCVQLYAFSEDDLETLRAIVPHLAVALDNAQNLAHAQGLSDILQTIASRLLSHHELDLVLDEAVRVALDVLQADTVVLYPRNPRSGDITDPIFTGDVRTFVSKAAEIMDPQCDSAVQRLLKRGKPQFTNHAAQDPLLIAGPTTASPKHLSSFIYREQIRASAALPLRIGADVNDEIDAETTSLGILFINYRKGRLFTPEYQTWCIALADLMALAIQNAWLHKRVANEERANQWREIHDGMAQYAGMTRMLLEQVGAEVERDGMLGIDGVEKLITARTGIQQLQRQVNYLIEIWRDRDHNPSSRDTDYGMLEPIEKGFAADLKHYTDIVRKTMEIRCESTFSGDDTSVPLVVQHEAHMIIREAVHNALRHGKATSIGIGVHVAERIVHLCISDNGTGFTPETVGYSRGLGNIRYRANKRGGTVTIKSAPGEGATFLITLPF